MGIYSVKDKETGQVTGYRYRFKHQGRKHQSRLFPSRSEAIIAEGEHRKEICSHGVQGGHPPQQPNQPQEDQIPPQSHNLIDMDFFDLVEHRLDILERKSRGHYSDVKGLAAGWVQKWGDLKCSQVTTLMIEKYLIHRAKDVSNRVANRELTNLKALFNYGLKKKYINMANPCFGIEWFPVKKVRAYVPSKEDVMKVISVAPVDTQEYLWSLIMTAARVNEINNLTWQDVNLDRRLVTLWTRKRKNGNQEPRDIPVIERLFKILHRRQGERKAGTPWVFYHTYWSKKQKAMVTGPYQYRKRIMHSLCRDAGVPVFTFHSFRHLTASILDDMGVDISVIQRILGHQNRTTTEIYLHKISDGEKKAMARLEREVDLFACVDAAVAEAQRNMHSSFHMRKVERPAYEQLKQDIAELGYRGAGRKYRVSDNAIRKWERFYLGDLTKGKSIAKTIIPENALLGSDGAV